MQQARAIGILWGAVYLYDFVHRWTPPDSVSGDDFAAESELFSKTTEAQEPLGDELPRGPMDMLSQLMGMTQSSNLAKPVEPIKFPSTGRKPARKKSRARRSGGKKKPKKRKR